MYSSYVHGALLLSLMAGDFLDYLNTVFEVQ
jgi:hypothetical protein